MSKLNGGQALVAALRHNVSDLVFGIPGTHNLAVFPALAESGIRTVLTRHEQGAGYAADGYARVTGKPGVCLTTTGPAILNAATAAAQAWSDSVPVLFVSPGMPTGHPGRGNGYLHEVKDQRGAMGSVTAYSHRVGSVAEIPHAVATACAAMTSGRPRPVHLEIPLDLLEQTAEVRMVAPVTTPRSLPSTVDDAIRILSAAQRPVLVAGGGARGAAAELRALAERLGAPVVTSANGKGVFDEDHPLAVGAGLHQSSVRALVERSDAVLAVGAELAPTDLWNGPFAFGGTMLRIDVDAEAMIANVDPDVRLLGDAATVLGALAARCVGTDAGAERARQARTALRADAAAEGAPWQGILAALAPVVDADTIITGDSTMTCYYGLLSGLAVHRPAGFLYPAGLGTLGYGLPAAIGAALAEPDARVLAVLGDGGIMFTIAELATAAQLGLPLPVLVVDNGGYGEIRNEMLQRGDPVHAVQLGGVDFPAVAEGMGCHGVALRGPGELTDAVVKAWQADRPTLLHLAGA